jgi:hypothetical protein
VLRVSSPSSDHNYPRHQKNRKPSHLLGPFVTYESPGTGCRSGASLSLNWELADEFQHPLYTTLLAP